MFKTKLVFGYYADREYYDWTDDYEWDDEEDDFVLKDTEEVRKKTEEKRARRERSMRAFLATIEKMYDGVEIVREPNYGDEGMDVVLNIYSNEFIPFRVFLERHWGPRSYNVERSDDPPLRDLYQ